MDLFKKKNVISIFLIVFLFITFDFVKGEQKNIVNYNILKQKAEAGDIKAQIKLGLLLKDTSSLFYGTEKNDRLKSEILNSGLHSYEECKKEAAKWFSKAAYLGDPVAQYELALMYCYDSSADNDETAIRLLRKSAEQNYAPAQCKLGNRLIDIDYVGHKKTANCEEGLKWLNKAAEQDYLQAIGSLSEVYADGSICGQKNPKKAMVYLRKGAELGDKELQFALGVLYCWGNGIPEELFEASPQRYAAEKLVAEMYRIFIEQGKAAALAYAKNKKQLADGHLCLDWIALCPDWIDSLPPQDFKEAAKWFYKAAQKKSYEACLNYGHLLYMGKGVKKDLYQAQTFYTKAAEDRYGGGEAEFMLALIYYNSDGNMQDISKAIECWEKSMIKSVNYGFRPELSLFASSAYRIGKCYIDGQGVPQNYAEAYKWFVLASMGGSKDYIKLRDEIAGKLTPDQIIKNQELANQWYKNNKR